MYALWSSIGRDKDPFIVVPAIPIERGDVFKKWTTSKIRKDILNAESKQLLEVKSNVLISRAGSVYF